MPLRSSHPALIVTRLATDEPENSRSSFSDIVEVLTDAFLQKERIAAVRVIRSCLRVVGRPAGRPTSSPRTPGECASTRGRKASSRTWYIGLAAPAVLVLQTIVTSSSTRAMGRLSTRLQAAPGFVPIQCRPRTPGAQAGLTFRRSTRFSASRVC